MSFVCFAKCAEMFSSLSLVGDNGRVSKDLRKSLILSVIDASTLETCNPPAVNMQPNSLRCFKLLRISVSTIVIREWMTIVVYWENPPYCTYCHLDVQDVKPKHFKH